MSTILPLGTTVCQACRAPVAIVRRTVEVPCVFCAICHPMDHDEVDHTHAVPDVAWTVVDAEGQRHLCPVAP